MAQKSVDISEIKSLERILRKAAPQKIERGLRRAVISTARKSRTQTTRLAAGEYFIGSTRVGKDVRLASIDSKNYLFTVSGSEQPISLYRFKKSKLKSGVKTTVLRSGSPTLLRNAFIATGAGGNKQIFERVRGAQKRRMKSGRYASSKIKRQPIRALKGPSAGDMMNHDYMTEGLADFALPTYETEVIRQIKAALR